MSEPRSATACLDASVDEALFREVIGRFASGVAVITASCDGRPAGTTASAMTSLSANPPMLLVCLNGTSETGRLIQASGRFAVNVLRENQAALARRFATKRLDKFEGVATTAGLGDVPLIDQAIASLECVVASTAHGGTHTVFLSNVERAFATEGEPLTYYRGRFGRINPATCPAG